MGNFLEVVASMPGLKELTPDAREGLMEQVVSEVSGAHRWPFLLEVQRELSWVASDSIQSFPGISRIWSIMAPDSVGNYYRLEEKSDIEFQQFIEMNPNESQVRIWRDAGLDGNDLQIEMYSVPSSAKTLKVDYTGLPGSGDVSSLPARFQGLIRDGMMAALGTFPKTSYMASLQMAIAREKDLQGKRSHVGKDQIQSVRFSNINNPS